MKSLLYKFFITVCLSSFAIYSYLKEQNKCTEVKMRLPKIAKEIEAIEQENAQLEYQIVCFESPENLLHLSKNPTFAHLKFPFFEDVLNVKEGLALQYETKDEQAAASRPRSAVLAQAK